VPEVERYICMIKERTRCIYNTSPFTRMPTRIVIEMVYSSVFWLNMFPANDGISTTMSPRSIIAGMKLDYTKDCRLEFGTYYIQVHEEHDNSMAARTTGAIALRPIGNDQGGHYFYSLSTGQRLNRNRPCASTTFAEDNDEDMDDESYNPDDDPDANDECL
jgi:hypothetical protein